MKQTVKPRRILGVSRNVFFLGLTSFFQDISGEMIFTIMPLFLANVLGVKTSIIGLIESGTPGGCGGVVLAHLSSDEPACLAQVSLLVQLLERGVQGAGAQVVAVAPQFGQHLAAVYRASGGVVQYVHLDETQKELFGKRSHNTLSEGDIAI